MPTAQQRESIRVMSATEEVVGVHVDGAKAVLCTSHGMVCAWDARSWQQTLSSFVGEFSTGKAGLEPVTPNAVSVGGEWVAAAAGSTGKVHCLSVAGHGAGARPSAALPVECPLTGRELC